MQEVVNGFRFSSGKEIYAYNNVLGLKSGLNIIYYGYDGDIDTEYVDYDDEHIPDVTIEEEIEICSYMIDLWNQRLEYAKRKRKDQC